MLRRMLWCVLALGFFVAPGPPAHAAEAYQVSTISSLLAGGYDGTTTIGQMLRHGNFGLGTFNGVDGEMMVLDGRVYRATTDGRAHLVASTELTPFAVVVPFSPQTSMPVGTGQSLDQLEAALDALPYSASRIFAARVDGRFQAVQIRSEPKQNPPYRPLAEVIKTQQVVHALNDVQGTLIAFRFPAAASSVNVAGWHFHFLSADKTRGGHVLGLTTGDGLALVEEISDLRISFPASAPASAASEESIKAVERPRYTPDRVHPQRAIDPRPKHLLISVQCQHALQRREDHGAQQEPAEPVDGHSENREHFRSAREPRALERLTRLTSAGTDHGVA